jgi:DNA-cytosine methyltransferase
VIVSSFRSVATSHFLALPETTDSLEFVVEIESSFPASFIRARGGVRAKTPLERLKSANWRRVSVTPPAGSVTCFAADLGSVRLVDARELSCFALSLGGISNYRRGIIFGLSSLPMRATFGLSVELLAWTRWIRLVVRRTGRIEIHGRGSNELTKRKRGELKQTLGFPARPNRVLAKNWDAREAKSRLELGAPDTKLARRLTASTKTLNVVELFAGAGGMGLGFLNAKGPGGRTYRVIASAEISDVYVQTLNRNHEYMVRAGLVDGSAVPQVFAALDLCSLKARTFLSEQASEFGGADIVIGGPPCQGFSTANRNSWSSANPNNRLVDAFLDCVKCLNPKVLLMENVQGILWTPRDRHGTTLSVAAHVLRRLENMGYLLFPKVLDAVWYGVPQNRSRFFLMGVHRDLGYTEDDFGQWGPFPLPTHGPGTDRSFLTVRDAIADLPRIGNGEALAEQQYSVDPSLLEGNAFLAAMRNGTPPGVIWDHVTSRHSQYVIERYRAVPRGGNWEDVRHLMTNYADVQRTHSNIYKRLTWDEPSITIGHYRKSMLIHPSQHRGLSLREAARLQSFPDWFRFAGASNGGDGGLMHKQQQLANAVCPCVTEAVAKFVLKI